MSFRRKSLAAVFSFSDKQKEVESSRQNSMDPTATRKEKPTFGSVTLNTVLDSAQKPNLISVNPSISIAQAFEIMKNNKIFSLPLKSRSKPGISCL